MQEQITFGQWLKRRRRMLDLTQDELSQAAGCATTTIRKFEADERRPSKLLAKRLAETLNIASEEYPGFIGFARTEPGTEVLLSPALREEIFPWQEPILLAGSLPAPLTPLLGRDRDVVEVRNYMVQPTTRLLTIFGPPGVGKTRLSIAVAAELVDAFRDGVFFVELAPLNDPNLIAETIVRTLGLRPSGDSEPSEFLQRFLAAKQALLVLDSFERLLAGASFVSGLLQACPGIKALVTSRAALRLRGEKLYPLPPLLLPNSSYPTTVEALRQYPSVALFVARSEEAAPAFQLTADNATAVAKICISLDGLPLAIELAAARVRLMPPQEMLARLTNRLELLQQGPRDLPERHQTLQAAIDWSYGQLNRREQTLLGRLGVFVGGCSLEAAERVAGVFGDEKGGRILDDMTVLMDNSLVIRSEQAGQGARFTMLQTIREYALNYLRHSGGEPEVRQRHATYYLNLAQEAEPQLRGPDQVLWLSRLEREHNNLSAALDWLLETDQTETALQLAGALWRFWELHSYLVEGRRRLEAALAQSLNLDQSLALGREESISRRHLAARAKAFHGLSHIAKDQGDVSVARAIGEKSLAIWQKLEDDRGQAAALHTLGLVAQQQGDYTHAARLHAGSLDLARKLRDPVGIYISLYNLAEISLAQGDYDRAAELHEQSLALKREQGDTWSITWSLFSLAKLAGIRGDWIDAAQLYKESLQLRRQLADKQGIAESLAGIANVAVIGGQVERAARLSGAVERLIEACGGSLSPAAGELHDRSLTRARAQLGETVFESLYREGQAMAQERAIAYALTLE